MRPTHLINRLCLSVRRLVRRSVRRSVRPYVRYASAKTTFLGCFWPRWDPILKQMINQPTCSSICLSIHVTWSIHAETRPGRIVARLGLFISLPAFGFLPHKAIQQCSKGWNSVELCFRHNSRSPRRSMGKISHFGNQINSTYLYIIVKVIHYGIWIHIWNLLAGSNLYAN